MSDLTDFLLARIAETEALIAGDWVNGDGGLHIISLEADRWLKNECEAKRRIVERVGAADDGTAAPGTLILGDNVLAALALPYAEHPDYRDEWRA